MTAPLPPGWHGDGTWICQGCSAVYQESETDLITGHVEYCDYTDDAGWPRQLMVKFSVIHYYLVPVDGPALAEAAGGRQPSDIYGPADEDGPACAICDGALEVSGLGADAGYVHAEDSDDAHTPVLASSAKLAQYLYSLAAEHGPAARRAYLADSVEISDIYPEESSG